MPVIIRKQWGALIKSNNPIKDSHVKKTIENIESNLLADEVYIKYELHENGEETTVTVYGYGDRRNENVQLFTRAFRKYLRLHGHVLEGNIWLYGEKEIEIQSNSEQKDLKELQNKENQDVNI